MKIKDLVRPNILGITPYSSARNEYSNLQDGVIFLDANENPFDSGYNRYPDPNQRLIKDRLAEIKGVKQNQILLGNGSDEVLDLILRTFCEPGKDQVIILPPTYGMYKVLANIHNVGVIEVQLIEKFQPDVERILNVANEKTKVLFLCSPNNPTANSFSSNLIEELVSGFNGIVVIDEAYIDFSNKDSWIHRLEDFSNLIVTQTFSKSYGMAGIRLGVSYASETITEILDSIKPPYNVNQLTQDKALECLQSNDQLINDVKEIINHRNWLISELKLISIVSKVYESDSNFILVKVKNAEKLYQLLINHKIVTRNRSNQPLCENCLRLTIGKKDENIKLISILKTLK